MTNAEALKRLRNRRKIAGLCPTCGSEREDKTKVNCLACRTRPNKEYMKTLRERRHLEGKCTRCGREPELGYALCPECREYIANWRAGHPKECP